MTTPTNAAQLVELAGRIACDGVAQEADRCPCGGEAVLRTFAGKSYVMCRDCRTSTQDFAFDEDAILAWNCHALVGIEASARAIAASKRGLSPSDAEIDRVWTSYVGQARAAIIAWFECARAATEGRG